MTTEEPVMNPEFVAVVYFNPIVCVIKLRYKNTPKNIPGPNASFTNFFFLKTNAKKRIIAAIPKRLATKSIDEISRRDSLTITNVAPHNNVIKRSALSEVKRECCLPLKLFIGGIVAK